MSGVGVQPLEVNGWTIRACDANGYDVVRGDERYHESTLEGAVLAAQRARCVARPTEPADPFIPEQDGPLDPVRTAKAWVEGMRRSQPPNWRAHCLTVLALLEMIEQAHDQMTAFEGEIERHARTKTVLTHGTPEECDAWVAQHIPDAVRLRFYQWLGALAVGQAVADQRGMAEQIDDSGSTASLDEYFTAVDPGHASRVYGPYPIQLPVAGGAKRRKR